MPMDKQRNPHHERIRLARTGWTLDFRNCPEVVAGIDQVFRGWGLERGSPKTLPHARPRAVISRRGKGWHWRAIGAPKARDWDRVPPTTPMRVITDVHDAAIYWYLADHPDLLCLHGGAVRIGRGLVCFPAAGRTGKSTLVANFAALGHKVFSDDVLALDGIRGQALGLLPRLRQPLAANLAPGVQDYIARHTALADDSWLYLRPDPPHIARLGETSPIKAFVLLERRDCGEPALEPAGTADVLKHLIAENIIRKLPMTVIFERLHRLARSRARFRLTYSDPLVAARYLAERLA